MTERAKTRSRRLVVGLTWLVVLWPLVHLVLVEVACVNPWRLMGFAMYATEHEIRVTLKKHVAGGPPVDVAPHDLPPEARDAYEHFVAKRAVLGRLYSPASFVATWRRAEPNLGRVEVDIEVLRLKRARMTPVARDRLFF
jgi:hypothetical protein